MRQTTEPVQFRDLGRTAYDVAWQLQREAAAARRNGSGPDTVFLVEHPSVYTAGRRTQPEDRPTDGTPVIDVDRGGRITWHGPGQLVGYPIVALAEPIDVVAYVRLLEQVLIEACAEVGVTTGRVPGRSGVWLPATDAKPERKVAAIGVRIAQGITQHGFALNCSCDLDAFGSIVPCGISDAGVTSLSAEAGRAVTIADMTPIVRTLLTRALNGDLPLTDTPIRRLSTVVTAADTARSNSPSGDPGNGPIVIPDLHRDSAPRSTGKRLLRIEERNSQVPIEHKPAWIRTRVRTGPNFTDLHGLVKQEGLHTVCQEAGCPNIYECWEDREATFLIGGDTCTRRCDFCLIKTGRPGTFDADEPRRVGESVAKMQLRYATVTGVTRDDLADEGAWLYAETIRQIHRQAPGTDVEILTPDFSAKPELLQKVFDAEPAVFAHNLETVPRIFKKIRPAFNYQRSLDVLAMSKAAGLLTKSNLILGMGETREEISQALVDLHAAGCDLMTITQYLRPSPRHHPIVRWVKPQEFVEIREEALRVGFLGVMSGPLVRSSYRAGTLYRQAIEARQGAVAG